MTSLSHKGFKAWISSEGQKLPVYDVKTEGSTITCWIPSSPDTPFSVVWRKIDPRPIASSGHVFVDGKDVASGVMRPHRKRHVERSAAKISTSRARSFYFTTLDLTDDEFIAPVYDDRLQEAGTIKLEVSFVKIGTEVPIVATEVENITIAHEKAKKAGAMITTYGDAERIEKGKAVSTSPYDPTNPGPQVTFIFRYHQKAMLQARGIIPCEGRKRSRNDLEFEDCGIHVGETEGVINLESDEEEESPPKRVKRTSSSPVFDFSQTSSEPLYDMGETLSLFNDGDSQFGAGRRSGTRSTRGRNEDVMSETSSVDPESKESSEYDEQFPPSSASVVQTYDEEEEPDDE